MTRMSVSCSSRWVAKLCRRVCGDTRFLIPAASAAAWTARLSWRVDSGSIGLRPGNSQPRGSSTPSRRPSRHHARSSSSSCGDSMGTVGNFMRRLGMIGAKESAHAATKEPHIPDAILDQLLAGADPKTAFDPNGLIEGLKKALAERVLNAEMDHHPAGDEPGNPA